MAGKLAELFVDITLRGGGKVALQALRDQIDAADKSLKNNATLYQLQTQGKLDNLRELSSAQSKLAKIDEKTYESPEYRKTKRKEFGADISQQHADTAKVKVDADIQEKFWKSKSGADLAAKKFQAERIQKQALEAKQTAMLTAQYGKLGAAAIQARQKFAGMLPWPLSQVVNSTTKAGAIMAVGAMAFHAAKNSSPEVSSTFDKSAQLASNSLGRIFVPAVMQAASFLQTLSKTTDATLNWLDRQWAKINWIVPPQFRNLGDGSQGAELSLPNARGSFGDIESAWRNMMQASGSGGTLEVRLLRQQLEILERIMANTNPGNIPRPGNQ